MAQSSLKELQGTWEPTFYSNTVLDKCTKAAFKNCKLTCKTTVELDIDTIICELDQEETNKYLGIDKGNGIQHSKIK